MTETEARANEFNELLELIEETMDGISATDVAMQIQMRTLNWLFLRVSRFALVPGMQRIIQLCNKLVLEDHSHTEYMAILQELDAALATKKQAKPQCNLVKLPNIGDLPE